MNPLFHQDAVVVTLGSGSRGNCTYIGDQKRGVLVDCGLSTLQIMRRMEQVGLGDAEIEAVLVTHEHSDHVGAARILDNRIFKRTGRRVPFFMSPGTDLGLNPKVRPTRIERCHPGYAFHVGSWRVEPYHVPHDTAEPVAFMVTVGEVRAGVITDLGRSTRLVERQLAMMDIAVLEFNHDVDMLMQGEYPWSLKQRVRGPHGHLSNEQSAELLKRGASPRLKHLVLAHLSEDNNQPELALEHAAEALHDADCTGVTVHVAHQQIPLDPFRVRTPLHFRPVRPKPRDKRTRAESVPDEAHKQIAMF